jgi:hypothetical protein
MPRLAINMTMYSESKRRIEDLRLVFVFKLLYTLHPMRKKTGILRIIFVMVLSTGLIKFRFMD